MATTTETTKSSPNTMVWIDASALQDGDTWNGRKVSNVRRVMNGAQIAFVVDGLDLDVSPRARFLVARPFRVWVRLSWDGPGKVKIGRGEAGYTAKAFGTREAAQDFADRLPEYARMPNHGVWEV